MNMPSDWWDVAFLACLPVFFLLLFFVWLVFVSRGRRAVNVDLSGFGVALKIESIHIDNEAAPPAKEGL